MSPGDPTSPLWQSGVLCILATWSAQKTAWAGASFLLASQGEHRPLQDQPELGGCELPPIPHAPCYHFTVGAAACLAVSSVTAQQPVKELFYARTRRPRLPLGHPRPTGLGPASEPLQELTGPCRLPSICPPPTDYLPRGLWPCHGGSRSSCQPCVLVWVWGLGMSETDCWVGRWCHGLAASSIWGAMT